MTGSLPKSRYLYDMVHSSLRQEILDGMFQKGDLLPSEKEIAQRFGVERTTVRRALDILVRENLVEKRAGVGTRVIYEAVAPNAADQPAFGGGQGNIIGFFMTDSAENSRKITQPYYADLFYYLEIECKANNCQLIYATIDPQTNMTEVLKSQNFRSVVFVTQTERRHIEAARRMGIPTILVNEHYEDMTTISYDNVQGANRAMQYLIEMGHRDIALITGPRTFFSTKEKMAGCYKALAEARLSLNEDRIVEGDWEFQSGYDCTQMLFSQKKPHPTAVFAFNDMMAIGVMRALHNLSISVPDEVSVVGFDNMEQLQYTEPDLTTVDTHVAFMARVIVDNVINHAHQYTKYGVKLLTPADLIVRNTVKRLI